MKNENHKSRLKMLEEIRDLKEDGVDLELAEIEELKNLQKARHQGKEYLSPAERTGQNSGYRTSFDADDNGPGSDPIN